jgi:hypothetical protein
MCTFLPMAQQPTGSHNRGCTVTHQIHHTQYDPSRRVISPSQRPLPDNTKHLQTTDINAPGGIRTYNPSNRAAADPCLSMSGQWNRLKCPLLIRIPHSVQWLGYKDRSNEKTLFESRQRLFAKASRLAPVLIQHHILWIIGIFPLGLSGQGVKLTTYLYLVPKWRIRIPVPPFPFCLYGIHRENFTLTLLTKLQTRSFKRTKKVHFCLIASIQTSKKELQFKNFKNCTVYKQPILYS